MRRSMLLCSFVTAAALFGATLAAGAGAPASTPAAPAQDRADRRPTAPGPPDHAAAPDQPGRPTTPDDDGGDDDPVADGPRLNDVQARGTHNSTHLDPKGVITDGAPFNWGYSHRTLTAQLEEQGVRQVEIDIHYNWAKDDFDVYHVWFGDDRVTCDTLSGCLGELRAWSDGHPDSVPLMVLIEPKDGGAPYSLAEGSTDPEAHLPEDGDPFTRPFDAAAYDRLDEVLLEAFDGPMSDGGRVVTPDDVTAPGLDLRTTITTTGWPLLDEVRGHVLYVVDGPDHAAPYSNQWTSLAGRAMFVQAADDAPVAAFVGRDGARLEGETKYDRMARLVAQGFMVRDLTSPGDFAAALAAGAHYLSTDYPEQLEFDDPDSPVRCNPVVIAVTGRSCTATALETHVAHGYPVPPDPEDTEQQVVADKVDRLVIGSVESAEALLPTP